MIARFPRLYRKRNYQFYYRQSPLQLQQGLGCFMNLERRGQNLFRCGYNQ